MAEKEGGQPIRSRIRAGRKHTTAQCLMENTPLLGAQACLSQAAAVPLALFPCSASSLPLKGLG